MTDFTDKQALSKTRQFFSIFIGLLEQRISQEVTSQRKIQEQVALWDEQKIFSTLAKMEKNANISDELKKMYQQNGSKSSSLDFYRRIAVNRLVHYQQLEENTKKIYPSFNQGACTAIPMSVLMKQENNPLTGLLSDHKHAWVAPKVLMVHLKKHGYGSYLYETSNERNFKTVFAENAVQYGAFIVIDLDKPIQSEAIKGNAPDFEKLERGHTLVYTNYDQNSREPLYISFDNNKYNDILSYKWQCGFVIDFPRIVYQEYQKQRSG